MMREKITDRINKFKVNEGDILNLDSMNLNRIPTELYDVQNLESLFLTRNKIVSLDGLEKLSSLEVLDLSFNDIVDISAISQLARLKVLYISHNKIRDIRPLQNLHDLKIIYISHNGLRDLNGIEDKELLKLDISYNFIKDIDPLCEISTLISLNLEHNLIEDISHLLNLNHLKELVLGHNHIETISPLGDIVQLQKLSLSNSDLSNIDWISKLNNLKDLDLSRNNISDTAPIKKLFKLEKLNLRENKISDLKSLKLYFQRGFKIYYSQDTYAPTDKKGIYLGENPITSPPIETLTLGSREILNYFRELELQGVDFLYEAKLLIVGEGGAGKTSLAKRLTEPDSPLPNEKDTTKGIDIYKYHFRTENEKNFTINVWDFGGQEIYHSTHQFFLTERSLYILIDDTRKDDKCIQDVSFKYWLQTSELFGGGSPMLIVQNEKGDRSKDIDLKGMKEAFPFILSKHETNLLTKRGLSDVVKSIEINVQNLPHIGRAIPKQWLKIREELQSIKEPTISREEFHRICEQYNIKEKDRQVELSRHFHSLGVFLHFQKDPVLKHLVILNNKWATEAVYRILDDEKVKSLNGILSKEDAERIWSDNVYKYHIDELIQLMMKFELSYDVNSKREKKYLFPQLLPISKPDGYKWDEDKGNQINLKYKYSFMPKGILAKFIVKAHQYLSKQDYKWRRGVLLEKERTLAEVIELYGENEILITVKGKKKKAFMTIIDSIFSEIHNSMHNLELAKYIPCCCENCFASAEPHYYNYDKLYQRQEKGKTTIECQTPDFLDVNVEELLFNVFETRTTSDFEENVMLKLAELKELGVENHNLLEKSLILSKELIDKIDTKDIVMIKNFQESVETSLDTNQAAKVFAKIEKGLDSLITVVESLDREVLNKFKKEVNEPINPKHKLKLALNLLFIKYEVEYDVLNTFKEIKEDFKNGNIFFKED